MGRCTLCGRAFVLGIDQYGLMDAPLCCDCYSAVPEKIAFSVSAIRTIRESIDAGMPVDRAIKFYLDVW